MTSQNIPGMNNLGHHLGIASSHGQQQHSLLGSGSLSASNGSLNASGNSPSGGLGSVGSVGIVVGDGVRRRRMIMRIILHGR